MKRPSPIAHSVGKKVLARAYARRPPLPGSQDPRWTWRVRVADGPAGEVEFHDIGRRTEDGVELYLEELFRSWATPSEVSLGVHPGGCVDKSLMTRPRRSATISTATSSNPRRVTVDSTRSRISC